MSEDKTIPAMLPHPEIEGPPLSIGTRYAHHFLVEVISDGRRLWAVASEEGERVLAYMGLRGKDADHTEFHDTIEKLEERRRARAAEQSGDYASSGVGVVANQSNPGVQVVGGHINANPNGDPEGLPAAGSNPDAAVLAKIAGTES